MKRRELFGFCGSAGRYVSVKMVMAACGLALVMTPVGSALSDVNVKEASAKSKVSVIKVGKAMIITSNGGVSVSKKNKLITIGKNGTYTLKGNFSSYRFIMNKRNMKVVLRLNGVTMKNTKTACIYNTKKSSSLNIQLLKGTNNVFTGPKSFPVLSKKTGEKSVSPDAIIMSDGNLSISGSGSLKVKDSSSNGNAIDSKKNIKISSGKLNIVSKNAALHADNVTVNGGTVSVSSSDTGIKASQKVLINNGIINVDAIDKGIQGRTGVAINNGTISIKTRKSSANGFEDFRGIAAGRGEKNGKTAVLASISISGGKISISSYGDCIHATADVNITGGTLSLTSTADHGIRAKQTATVKAAAKISISSKKKKVKADKINVPASMKL